MRLDEWRRKRGWSYSDLGRALETSAEAARRYCTDQRVPRPKIMARIRTLTGGLVTADDFVPTETVPNKPESLL